LAQCGDDGKRWSKLSMVNARAATKKVFQIILKIALGVLFVIISSYATDTAVLSGPHLADYIASPSTAKRCASIKNGMKEQDVLSLIDTHFPAHSQTLDGSRVTFSQGDSASCTLEFDKTTGRVTSTQFQPPTPPVWDLKNAD
jgi:hypothetical protein